VELLDVDDAVTVELLLISLLEVVVSVQVATLANSVEDINVLGDVT
jgi:hypothetical protein